MTDHAREKELPVSDPQDETTRPQIPVDCAVNDDYGNVSGRISAISFPGLELDAIDVGGVTFRQIQKNNKSGRYFCIRIGRREFPARHVQSAVGNIYWERYAMDAITAANLLHWLRDYAKTFTLDGGHDEVCGWWESSIRDELHVARLLIAAAKGDRL